MAPRLSGFTRASSLGPIAEFMDRQGGSIWRVLKAVDLPFVLLDDPDVIVPLREQFRLLERAARETGDEFFGARLGQVVRSRDLSRFGAWVCAGKTLREAIARAHAGLNSMLQTSTVLRLVERGDTTVWSIEFVEPETEGRHHNELLGVSYLIDTVRTYAGAGWRPDAVFTALPRGTPCARLEEIFGSNVSHGHPVSAIVFETALLRSVIPSVAQVSAEALAAEAFIPEQRDALATIAAVTDLALHEGYPRVDWVAAKLGTTRRSLQRLLSRHEMTFNRVVEQALMRRAVSRLADRNAAITDIALELGYADGAHFTRAFRRWTGMAPSAYRQNLV
ncbi:MAG: AraC family transcriptional regulator ligand-binding domain-containing protein [Hyphomicrobium sp.]|jgi:AraC-like DNA-binding protein